MALFDESGGKCCECGVSLSAGWHADHILAYSNGGHTVVENGRALCAKCNLKKGAKTMIEYDDTQLRDCQSKCISIALGRYREGRQTTAAYMSVGSGKTRAGATIASLLISSGMIDRVITVTPNGSISSGWSEEFTLQGLRVPEREGNENIELDLADSEHGYITTYQSIAIQPNQHRIKCLKRTRNGCLCRTLVIFDELHHLGENPLSGEDRTKWAEKATLAFGDATYILALTGTPVRSDNKSLPFIEYVPGKEDTSIMEAVLHYRYSYGEAVNDGYVRRCSIEYVEAFGEVAGEGGELIGKFSTSEKRSSGRGAVERASLAIRTSADVSGKAAEDIIDKGIERLRIAKQSHPRAAALAVCSGIAHADHIKGILKSKGQSCVVVHSGIANAIGVIKQFKKSSTDWIVAVGMVTEGVNIPRLRGCCYLTTITAVLTLDQILGRSVRVDWSDKDGDGGEPQEFDEIGQQALPGEAFFFCLNKPELVSWAEDVEKDVKSYLVTQDDEGTGSGGNGGGLGLFPELDVISLMTKGAGGTVAGQHIEEVNISLWRRFQDENPGVRCQTHEGVKIIDFLRKSQATMQTQERNDDLRDSEDYTTRLKRLRKECSDIVRRIVKHNNLDRGDKSGAQYAELHRWANSRSGIQNDKNADADQLKIKRDLLRELERSKRSAA